MGKSAGSKSVLLCSALLLMHGYGLSSLPSTFSFHPLTPRCKLHVFCCPPPFPVISFSCCRITRSSSSSSQLQLLPFEFRYTFPNINIVAATIPSSVPCRLAIPYLAISGAGLVVNKRNERILFCLVGLLGNAQIHDW